MKRRNKFLIGGAAAVLLLAALAAGVKSHSPKPEMVEAAAPQPVPVAVAISEARQVPVTLDATGSFVAQESSDVSPKVAGRVVQTPVDVGDAVSQGQVLVKLDDSDAHLRVQQARAQLEQAQATVRQAQSKLGIGGGGSFEAAEVPEVRAARAAYESAQAQAALAEADAQRYAGLVNTGDVSLSNYEKYRTQAQTAQAQVKVAREQYEAALNGARQGYQGVQTTEASLAEARVQVALAEQALADTVIRAPFSGYVSARPVAAGEFVATSSKVATVVRIQPIKLQVQVTEADAGKLSTGMPISARTASYSDRDFQGRVTAINPAVDPQSRALVVEATFTNGDALLKPGMFASSQIVLPGTRTVVYVPRAAVQAEADTNSAQVFVVEGNKVRLRVVQPGKQEGGMVQILSGLSGGETLVTGDLAQLYDGVPVQPKAS